MTGASDKTADAAWARIIPFVRSIEALIHDPEISDIMVNGAAGVFIEKRGEMRSVPGVAIQEKSLQVAVRNIARALGDEISEEKPLLDSRLPDGSRVAAVFPPCAVGGTVLTIRKFHSQLYTAEELVRIGSVAPEALAALRKAVEERKNILISGGTGTGKTTLLNALAAFIPDEERLVIIEDTSEIQIGKPNLVRLEARREQPGFPAVTIRDLLRTTLRLRPDRILLGEVRGGEAFDLLQALNTGHAGTLATLHANSAEQALARFTTCVLQSGVEMPYRAVRSNIAEALSLIVHIERRQGRRFVRQVMTITGYDTALDLFQLGGVYERE
jgi:pilus assembly protein CpaF